MPSFKSPLCRQNINVRRERRIISPLQIFRAGCHALAELFPARTPELVGVKRVAEPIPECVPVPIPIVEPFLIRGYVPQKAAHIQRERCQVERGYRIRPAVAPTMVRITSARTLISWVMAFDLIELRAAGADLPPQFLIGGIPRFSLDQIRKIDHE